MEGTVPRSNPCSQLLSFSAENNQPCPRRLPRADGNIHRIRNPIRLRRDRRGPERHLQWTSYLTSLAIAILGGAPLFWRPLGNSFGRRPVFLVSLVGSVVGNVGCAKSPSYGTMGLSRAITAFFISPAGALGSAVVAESFFKRDRGRCMGVWALMVTLGVPGAPFIFGFVPLRVGYRWIYWILAIVGVYPVADGVS